MSGQQERGGLARPPPDRPDAGRLAEQSPGQVTLGGYLAGLSWRARYLRESIARAEGDVDTVVAIYAAELDDHGRNHLRIASELDGAGRGDEALRRAERGLREAALLLSARACHLALGTPDEFTRYVAALRVEQKRKRNLMRILTQNGL